MRRSSRGAGLFVASVGCAAALVLACSTPEQRPDAGSVDSNGDWYQAPDTTRADAGRDGSSTTTDASKPVADASKDAPTGG